VAAGDGIRGYGGVAIARVEENPSRVGAGLAPALVNIEDNLYIVGLAPALANNGAGEANEANDA